MLTYFGCLFIVTFCAYISQRSGNDRISARLFAVAAFACLVMVAGFRDYTVGTDTEAYVEAFVKARGFADIWSDSSMEPGYLAVASIARFLSSDYWVLLTAISLVAMFFYMRSIYQNCENPAIALFVFVTMGYYTFFFNGARQGLACAVYSLAIGPLIRGEFKKYLLVVLLAFCFHRTAIIALPLYFLFRQNHSPRFLLQIVGGATLAIFFLGRFLTLGLLISDKYAMYQTLEATGGKLLTVFYVFLTILFVMCRKSVPVEQRRKYDSLLNMQILGSTIFVVVTVSGAYVELTRLAAYFQISSMFLWPMLYKIFRGGKERYVMEYGFLLGHLGYFYLFLSRMGSLAPYTLNPDLASLWIFRSA